MRKAKVFQGDELVGTLDVPDSYRPPITQSELDAIPSSHIAQSRSWLMDIRPGDFRLELREDGRAQEVVVVAHRSLAPGDFGCVAGFSAATGREELHDASDSIAMADEVLSSYLRGAR